MSTDDQRLKKPWSDVSDIEKERARLKAEIERLKAALEFYASRAVYERISSFPGDSELVECNDVAKRALE